MKANDLSGPAWLMPSQLNIKVQMAHVRPEKFQFLEKGKIVISVQNCNFD